jgi:parvulin-like peptidyl-prolyl isomerase
MTILKGIQDRLHFTKFGALFAIIVLALAVGCGGSDTDAAKAGDEETPEVRPVDARLSEGPNQVSETTAAEEPSDPNEVVATVNGEPVTRGELDRETDALMRQTFQGRNVPGHAQMRDQFEQRALDAIILKRQIMAYADKNDVTLTEEEVDEALEQVKSRFPSEEQFEAMIQQMGVTMEDVREDIRENVLLRKAIDHYLAGLPEPTTDEIEAFYESHIQAFQEGEKVVASHILISATAGMSEEEQASAKAEAEDIRNQILEGADFAELAKEHSADTMSAVQGGELEPFERGRMVPPFEEAAFSLEPGDLSEPVKTRFGYHLIKVADHIEAGTREVGEVRDVIIRQLQQQDFMEWRNELVEKAKIEKMSGESGEQP